MNRAPDLCTGGGFYMIFKIHPWELFRETCFSCKHYKVAKKLVQGGGKRREEMGICDRCFVGEYWQFERRPITPIEKSWFKAGKWAYPFHPTEDNKMFYGSHFPILPDNVMLKTPLDEFKEGDRIIIGGHPRLFRYASIEAILDEHYAWIRYEVDSSHETACLISAIRVQDDGLDDKQRLAKLYHAYLGKKWSREQWEEYKLWIDDCLTKPKEQSTLYAVEAPISQIISQDQHTSKSENLGVEQIKELLELSEDEEVFVVGSRSVVFLIKTWRDLVYILWVLRNRLPGSFQVKVVDKTTGEKIPKSILLKWIDNCFPERPPKPAPDYLKGPWWLDSDS